VKAGEVLDDRPGAGRIVRDVFAGVNLNATKWFFAVM
jgi:hypothetical protein